MIMSIKPDWDGQIGTLLSSEQGIPILIFIGFILLGLALIIGRLVFVRHKKSKCTEQIKATCIALESEAGINMFESSNSRSSSKRSYRPIHQYYYFGQTYTTSEAFRNFSLPEVNSVTDIFINPDHPEEYYLKSPAGTFFYIMGVGCLFMGCFDLFMVLG